MFFVGITQFVERYVPEARQFGAWPDAAGHITRAAVRLVRVGHFAGDACCGKGDFIGAVSDAVFREHRRERAKSGGLERIDPHLEKIFVHLSDEVGSGNCQQFIATFEVLATKVVGRQVLVLHVGAECSVKNDHPFVDRRKIIRLSVGRHRAPQAKTSSVHLS